MQEENRRHREEVETRVEAVKKTVKDLDVAGRQEGVFLASDEGLDLMDEDVRSGIGSKRRR